MRIPIALLPLLLCACDSRPVSAALDEERETSAAEVPTELAQVLSASHGDLPDVLARRQLRVLVPYARPYFFITEGKPNGITYEMFREYARFAEKRAGMRSQDLSVVYVPCELNSIIPWLLEGYGDLAAAALTITPERAGQVSFTAPLARNVDEILVASSASPSLTSLDDLAGREVWVVAGSSYVEHLRALAADFEGRGLAAPVLRVAPATLTSADLLEMLNAGIFEFTVCDAYSAKLWAQVLDELRPLEDLKVNRGGEIAWAVRPGDEQLLASLNDFTREAKQGTLLGNVLIKRYLGSTRWIKNPVDKGNSARIERYAGWMRELAAEYDFDWLRIAAQCFQESGLDPRAVSTSGAMGLMQLMPPTAKDMGCEDPSDPEQNLRAGVRYLDWLRENFFSDPELSVVARDDFILAAYNAGPGNVRKWRAAAPARGLDPDLWRGNVELLARETVGVQPVWYVDNIEKYYVAYTLAYGLENERERILEGRR